MLVCLNRNTKTYEYNWTMHEISMRVKEHMNIFTKLRANYDINTYYKTYSVCIYILIHHSPLWKNPLWKNHAVCPRLYRLHNHLCITLLGDVCVKDNDEQPQENHRLYIVANLYQMVSVLITWCRNNTHHFQFTVRWNNPCLCRYCTKWGGHITITIDKYRKFAWRNVKEPLSHS